MTDLRSVTETNDSNAQQWRTRFVLFWMAILFLCSWAFSLTHLFDMGVWNRKHALEILYDENPSQALPHDATFFERSFESYLTHRYIWYMPHVTAAVVWWNFYFLQLVPAIRHNYKGFHRMLGRLLMVTALVQVVTGTGLAITSTVSTVKVVSLPFGGAVAYCLYHAYKYARARDIPRHKYWVLRLVGYLQTIAAQRFWLVVLVATHTAGVTFLYPSAQGLGLEATDEIVQSMFGDSFVLGFISSIYITEWYLAANIGGLHDAKSSGPRVGYERVPGALESS
jgi:hypothetical protein